MQAAKDLGVQLDVTRLPAGSTHATLAAQIRAILSNPPDALVTFIPSQTVASAVQEVIAAGIPVFGLNSGYTFGRDLGVLTWVAQDEFIAGEQAGATLLATVAPGLPENARVGFVNHVPGTVSLTQRFEGFNSYQPIIAAGLVAEEILLNAQSDYGPQLESLLGACEYDFVLLGGAVILEDTLSTLAANSCATRVGSFDESAALFQGLEDGTVALGMSQQKYLQGMLPIIFATTFATTGKVPAIPSRNPNGIFLSNGAPWTSNRIPSAERQLCIEDSFPVCPTVGESGCPYFDRSSIRIGGVLHGDTEDAFWDNVFSGAAVAAKDMGVQLELERFTPPGNSEALVSSMNAALAEFCTGNNPVDGVFVSIPNIAVVPAIRACRQAGIPTIAVNSGSTTAEDLDLQHFVGQLEFTAGFQAAESLAVAGATRGWCINHAPNVQSITQRCSGFQAGLAASGIQFVEEIIVNVSNLQAAVTTVEAAVNLPGTWADFGFILTGSPQAELGLELLAAHADAMIGTFDTSEVIFNALQTGQYLFAINQQPYFQGYLPIPLLTAKIQANRELLNFFIGSGPSFATDAPDADETLCQINDFEVCDGPQCLNFGAACGSPSECCSSRCIFSKCQKELPAPKTKLGDGRGGAGGASRTGNRRRVRGES